MKNLIIAFVGVIIISCSPKTKSDNTTVKGRLEITPYKETEIILKDTMQVKTAYARSDSGRVSMYEFSQSYSRPATFLNPSQFKMMEKAVLLMVKNPKSLLYKSWDSPPLNSAELGKWFKTCDTIDQISYSSSGVEEINKVFYCDSTSLLSQINKIIFYESWYFNPENNQIEREVMGYSVLAYDGFKEAWRELFLAVRDEEALKKMKLYH